MRQLKFLFSFSSIYLFVLACAVAAVIGGKVTHQGFVLGIVSIVTGLLLIHRSLYVERLHSKVNLAVVILLEAAACLVIAIGDDPTELRFASVYAIFSVLMVCDIILRRYFLRNRRDKR